MESLASDTNASPAEQLFEQHFVAPLAEIGIDARSGSGSSVLYELERRLPQGISPQQTEEVARNLRKLAHAMAEDAIAIYRAAQIRRALDEDGGSASWGYPGIPEDYEQLRLHEWSLAVSLRRLCPIFPFC